MTKFITAPTATGETFTFNSRAKATPVYAVVVTDDVEAIRAASQDRVAAATALHEAGTISTSEFSTRVRREAKELERSLAETVYMLSKHGSRAAGSKARDAVANLPTTLRAELVEVVPA